MADEVQEAQKLYDKHIAEAMALPASEVLPMRADLDLAYHNAVRGCESLAGYFDRIRGELPKVDVARISDVPEIAMAARFAATRVTRGVRSDGSTSKMFEEAMALRNPMLATAETLAVLGFLPLARVEQIRAGSGNIDLASDCVALADLFREHEKSLVGRHPFTKEQIDKAAALGTELLAVLRPAGAKKDTKPSSGSGDAVDIRDRLWTLLVRRHADMWRVGAWIFGRDEVDAMVPSLHFRVRTKKKQGSTPPAPPA